MNRGKRMQIIVLFAMVVTMLVGCQKTDKISASKENNEDFLNTEYTVPAYVSEIKVYPLPNSKKAVRQQHNGDVQHPQQ